MLEKHVGDYAEHFGCCVDDFRPLNGTDSA